MWQVLLHYWWIFAIIIGLFGLLILLVANEGD